VKRLDELGLSGATNIVVMSDQGVGHSAFGVNLNAELIRAGPKARDSDDVGIARSGQTQLIHLKNHDRTLFRRITEFLRAQGWAGVLFYRRQSRF
jgi:hypothetical protein